MRHCHCELCNKPLDHPGVTLKIVMRDVDPGYKITQTMYFCWACAQTISLDVYQYSATAYASSRRKNCCKEND